MMRNTHDKKQNALFIHIYRNNNDTILMKIIETLIQHLSSINTIINVS